METISKKPGAGHVVREILVCWIIASIGIAVVARSVGDHGSSLILAAESMLFGWLGIPLWGVYRVLRFAFGR